MYLSKIIFFPGLFDERTVTLHEIFFQLHTLLQMFTSNLSDSLNVYKLIIVTEIQFLLLKVIFFTTNFGGDISV